MTMAAPRQGKRNLYLLVYDVILILKFICDCLIGFALISGPYLIYEISKFLWVIRGVW